MNTIESKFLSSPSKFEQWRGYLQRSVRADKRLPDQVFQAGFGKFLFGEFRTVLNADFGPQIRELAQLSKDSEILMAVLIPDPIKHHEAYGTYNWVELSVAEFVAEYAEALDFKPNGNIADAVIHVASVVVWLPKSLSWVIWGERGRGVYIRGF